MSYLNGLKNSVIAANVAHSLGSELLMDDSTYDAKLAEIRLSDKDFDPMNYLPIPEGSTTHPHRVVLNELVKYSTNDIASYWNKEDGKVKTPKYDGSSIAIYYVDGVLSHILSMSDKNTGIDQTEKFRSFVPELVDPNVSFIRAEVVVDYRLISNSRGKANGLVNSKWMQGEVELLATIIAYGLFDYSGNLLPYSSWSELSLGVNYLLHNTTGRLIYLLTPEVHEFDLIEKGVASITTDKYNLVVTIDGIVYTEDPSFWSIWAYKYYFVTSSVTTVVDISWRETDREGYTSVLVVDTVTHDGKTITNPTTNGVPMLLEKSMGIGSKVEVAFSGLTIPQVISVVEPAIVALPVCPYCGHQMTEHDIYGSLLKCINIDCTRKYELREHWITSSLANRTDELHLNNKEYLDKWLEYYLMSYLNVSRFNYEKSRLVPFSSIKDQLLASISINDVTAISVVIGNSYNWSKLQWKEMLLSLKSTVLTINKYLND